MVTKDNDKSKVKVDPLKINTETVQDLTEDEIGKIKGGFGDSGQMCTSRGDCTHYCPTDYIGCTEANRVDCLGGPGPKDPPPPPAKSGWVCS